MTPTLILSLVAGLLKALPEIVSLIKDIRAEHAQKDRELQDVTAKQRYEIKQQSTANTIALAVAIARQRVQDKTASSRESTIG